MKQIEEKIYERIVQFLGEEKREALTGEESLLEDLDFDSIQIIELFSEIEEQFGIEFKDYETLLEQLDCMTGFIEYIAELIAKEKQ
ncbi:MAG: acyl carrier protein [Lachnospiraceae bacterium]|nr:acyl carrier protein [Lachnospiraceae bacterium]